MLKVSNLNVKNILNDVNINFNKKEITSIVGKNGSGKTTLVKAICSLIEFQGEINVKDKEISLIFQNPDIQFVKNIVEDDIAFGLENINTPKDKMINQINEYANKFGISDLLKRNISSLSGGEKQKIALVSNLILKPKVLILDEAFEMLDARSKLKAMSFVKKIVKEENIICINITHDNDILNFSDRIVGIKDKQIDFDLNIKEFYDSVYSYDYGFFKPLIREVTNKYDTLEELICNLD